MANVPHHRLKTSETSAETEVNGYFSSACLRHEISPEYNGFLSKKEVLILLFELLQIEQAVVKTCASSLEKTEFNQWFEWLLKIQVNGVKICQELTQSIYSMGASPPKIVNSLYDNYRAINDPSQRLKQLNQTQSGIVQKIQTSLPQISESDVFIQLKKMKEAHKKLITPTTFFTLC